MINSTLISITPNVCPPQNGFRLPNNFLTSLTLFFLLPPTLLTCTSIALVREIHNACRSFVSQVGYHHYRYVPFLSSGTRYMITLSHLLLADGYSHSASTNRMKVKMHQSDKSYDPSIGRKFTSVTETTPTIQY